VKPPTPTPASVALARSILEEDGNPFTNYLAATIGHVMLLNHDGLAEILEGRRDEFEARGAGDLLAKIQSEVDELFSGFFTREHEQPGNGSKP
jgi:hypothetical protein